MTGVRGAMLRVMGSMQEADVAPASSVAQAVPALHKSAAALLEKWKQIQVNDVAPLKQQLGTVDVRRLAPAAEAAPGHGVNKDED